MKNACIRLLTVSAICFFISFFSCDNAGEEEEPENQNPMAPSLSIPENQSKNIDIDATLSWQGTSDPDGDKISYNVYLDTNTNPGQIASAGQTTTSYDPDLNPNTTYFWKVEADDDKGGKSVSATWSFTTINNLPTTFNLIYPSNSETDVALDVKLTWESSSDPQSSDITYDVYFGTENPPMSMVSIDQPDTTYLPTLTEETTYYWKIMAKTESGGNIVSEVWSFTTMSGDPPVNYGSVTDPRDDREYKTIEVNGKTWMAENLAYLPEIHGIENNSETEARYYVYEFDPSASEGGRIAAAIDDAKAAVNYQDYGVLYNWPAAVDGSPASSENPSGVQGVCPTGWHIPSRSEWNDLENYLSDEGFTDNQAYALKSTSGWYDDGNGSDAYGLAFLPGGSATPNFTQLGMRGYWWSTSDFETGAYYIYLSYQSPFIRDGAAYKYYAMSVRCIHD